MKEERGKKGSGNSVPSSHPPVCYKTDSAVSITSTVARKTLVAVLEMMRAFIHMMGKAQLEVVVELEKHLATTTPAQARRSFL